MHLPLGNIFDMRLRGRRKRASSAVRVGFCMPPRIDFTCARIVGDECHLLTREPVGTCPLNELASTTAKGVWSNVLAVT